ncbi:MAG: hypothetical protein IJJ75_03890 [Firmicutes bacterium]|nr:hypothetical protein [Bacillota bacterium]
MRHLRPGGALPGQAPRGRGLRHRDRRKQDLAQQLHEQQEAPVLGLRLQRPLSGLREEQRQHGRRRDSGEFLEFARDNYPAEKTGLIFWNHGGGSVTGAAFDELYNYDSLSLYEMYAACGSIFGTDPENPPLEMVGFDTCLMATIDVAYTFSDIARYLVASEESEPGNGWFYTQWVQALANDTSMDGAELGREICDAFAYGCQKDGPPPT